MSLLLDALKKAADDKKKSVDDSADESLVQDDIHTSDDDSLELELEDNNFPQVEDQPVVSQTQQTTPPADNHTETAAVSENNDELDPDTSQDKHNQDADSQTEHDNAHIEQVAEMELSSIQTTGGETTDSPDESQSEPLQNESLPTATIEDSTDSGTAAPTATQNTEQSSAAEATQTINPANHAERPRHSAENEAALSALINKSNQYQQRAQKKRTILLVTLILLLISGSALFFYLKTEMASQELYIAQNNSSPVLREPPLLSNRSEPTTGNKTAVTNTDDNNTLAPDHTQRTETTSHKQTNKQPMVKPRTTQTVSPERTVVANKATNTSSDRNIHIQQSSRDDPIEPLIMNAYNAFQQGQYEQAETLYQQVLAQEPRNRDAMLGLAATALKQQHYEVARQKYLALLQLNPRDSMAIAGLSSVNKGSLQHSSDTTLNESQLKFMLKEQPDAPHLYFALGSLYAGKNQWPQAQSAYFSAWSADSNNADYAFNLAVSLDHINQSQQALQYYQLCLKLMPSSSANFSAAQVKQRINSLQEAM